MFFHIATPVFLQPSLLYIIGWLASQSFIQFNKKEKRFQIWCDLPKEARSCSPRGSHSNNKPATAPSIAFYCPSSCVLPSFSIAFSCLPSLCIALCRLSPTVVLYQLELYLHSDSLLTLPVQRKRRERVFKLQENWPWFDPLVDIRCCGLIWSGLWAPRWGRGKGRPLILHTVFAQPVVAPASTV